MKIIHILNYGDNVCYIGDSGVTVETGIALKPKQTLYLWGLSDNFKLHAAATSGEARLTVLEQHFDSLGNSHSYTHIIETTKPKRKPYTLPDFL